MTFTLHSPFSWEKIFFYPIITILKGCRDFYYHKEGRGMAQMMHKLIVINDVLSISNTYSIYWLV